MKINEISYLTPAYIIKTFWTADYSSKWCGRKCGMHNDLGYHDCDGTGKVDQWDKVLTWARYDEHYEMVYKIIKKQGFLAPLAARLNGDGSVTFVDGHHRLCAAEDLDIFHVPVYIGSQTTSLDDLVAIDSQMWDGRSLDSPFLGMVA